MDWQLQILNDPHPIKVIIGGRQVGKSHLLEACLAKTCGESPGNSAVVMPLQTQANQFAKLMSNAPGMSHLLLPGEKGVKQWPHFAFNWRSGHYLEWRSFENPDALRGGKWTGVVLNDEANDLDGDMISRVILPKVSTTNAPIYITSTITHHNWLWDWYLKGQTNDKTVKSWLIPTANEFGEPTPYGYKFQGQKGRERLHDLHSMTAQWIFDSEYCCIPGSDNSTAFPYVGTIIVKIAPPKGPNHGERFLIGLDLGRVRDQEYAVVLRDDGLVVDTLEFPTGSASFEHSQMAQRINTLSRYWNNARVVVDCTGKGGRHDSGDSHADIYKEILEDRCEPMYWSGNKENESKYNIISHLSLMIEQKKIQIPEKFRTLTAQLQSYRILKSKGKNSTFGPSPKSGVNDDAVAALAQAVWGMKSENDWFGEAEEVVRHHGGSIGGIIG